MISLSACTATARAPLLHSLVLLVLGLVSWPIEWEAIRTVLDSLRSSEPSRGAGEGPAPGGYYAGLIGGTDGPRGSSPAQSPWMVGQPDGWVRFPEADVVRYLEDDFLQFELKPLVQRTLFGQPFVTNAFGMHDEEVTLEKPEGTFRIAVLGASMDMGWGVKHQDTYINRLQEWLTAWADRQEAWPPRRFEVLNFAVAAYSPLQRLDVLRRKVLAFHPDLVIYSATTLDVRLMEIHLCDMLRKRVDLKYGFLRSAVAEAGIDQIDLRVDASGKLVNKDRLKSKMRPFYWGLYDATLGMIAADCRCADVPLVMVIIPRVGKADAPGVRAEPVARLKVLAARNALTVYDLSDAFDAFDPAELEIAAWDDHPNALGHQRLFLALARAVVKDQEVYHLLFPPDPARTAPLGPPLAPIDQQRAGAEAKRLDSIPEV